MYKNVAGQIIYVYAQMIDGAPVLSDAANITAVVSKDGGATAASNDTNPTEIGKGVYAFTLTQAETNCNHLALMAESSTPGVLIGAEFREPSNLAVIETKVDTVDDFLDTEIAAIKTKTDSLPSDPADASDIAAAFFGVNTKLDTIDDLIDTEVTAIKTDTGNILIQGASISATATAIFNKVNPLPTDPADQSLIIAATDAIAALVTTVDTVVDAIKLKTDLIVTGGATEANVDAAEAAILSAIDDIPGGGGSASVAIDFSTAVSNQNVIEGTKITVDQSSGRPEVKIIVMRKDENGTLQPYDLDGKEIRLVFFDKPDTIIKQLETADLTIADNLVTVDLNSFPELTQTPGLHYWDLWEIDDTNGDMRIGTGSWSVNTAVLGE